MVVLYLLCYYCVVLWMGVCGLLLLEMLLVVVLIVVVGLIIVSGMWGGIDGMWLCNVGKEMVN